MEKNSRTYKELLEKNKELDNLLTINTNRRYFLDVRKRKEINLFIDKISKNFDGNIDPLITVFKNKNNRIEILNNIVPIVKKSNLKTYIEYSENYNKYIQYVFEREDVLIEKILEIENKYESFINSIDVDNVSDEIDNNNNLINNVVDIIRNDINEIDSRLSQNINFDTDYKAKQSKNMYYFNNNIEDIDFKSYNEIREKALKDLTVKQFKL